MTDLGKGGGQLGKRGRNALVQQIKVNRREQRTRVFRNGGRIISYTMSNTESWAWANPPTKKLRARSLKPEFSATESGPSLGVSIKDDDFVFFGELIFTFWEMIGLDISYCVFIIYSWVPVLHISLSFSFSLCVKQDYIFVNLK